MGGGSTRPSRLDRVSPRSRIILFLQASPSPGDYERTSDFDIGNPDTGTQMTKAGVYTFGVSREAYKKVYLPKAKVTDPLLPGPGAYTVKLKQLGTEGQKWGFRGRSLNVNDPRIIKIKQDVPGPGHYEPGQDINRMGVYHLSTI